MDSIIFLLANLFVIFASSKIDKSPYDVSLSELFVQEFNISKIMFPEFLEKINVSAVRFIFLSNCKKDNMNVILKKESEKGYLYGVLSHNEFKLVYNKTCRTASPHYYIFFKDKRITKKTTINFKCDIINNPNFSYQRTMKINNAMYNCCQGKLKYSERLFLDSFLNEIRNRDIVVYRCIGINISILKRERYCSVIQRQNI